MLKHELRKIYKEKRNAISPFFISEKSIQITNNVLKLPIWRFDYFHIFLSIKRKKEVDTQPLITLLQGKDKNIIIPKMIGDNSLKNYLLTDSTPLKENHLGVPEPIEGIEVPEEKLQVVFMPLLAFDLFGNRVGYGKGYYDHFLKKCNSNIIKIGLSFFEAEKIIADTNENDVRLNFCITPDKVYEF